MRLHTLKELDSSEGTVKLHTEGDDGTFVLHPTPNPNDPNDPLRWPKWKKHFCFGSVCAFTFLGNFAIGGLAPAFYILSLEFDKTQSQTSELLLWPILVLGAFNFFWVPMANYLGKRPVFVFASLLLSLCYLWGAVADSFESLLWSNIIAAFAASSTEALGASIVNDLYFLHERANLMGVYMNFISGGNTIGPLLCGFITSGVGWRWHKWLAFILTAINFLAVVFVCPETSSIGKASDEEEAPIEKTTSSNEREVQAQRPSQVPPKTYLQQLSLWSGVPKDTSLLRLFLRPFPFIAYPAVAFSFLGYAVSLAWVVAINILSPFLLQVAPYNFGPSVIGLINIPGLLGNLFGAWAGGWLVDRYSDRYSKQHNGVFQPESRLHLLWIPTLVVPAGCLAFGYGGANGLHWTALFFGYGMVAVGLTFVPVATMTYVSDCYLPVNADALLLVNGLKNIVAFGFLHGVDAWVQTGYVSSFGTMAGIFVAIMALAIPLVLYGERIRHRTALWRVIL
ncbi:hypothetical protein MBLNU13_g08410t1 [Cladosporium sp. NU13]